MGQVRIDGLNASLKSAIRNLEFAILMGAMLFALCSSADAQQTRKIPRIGYRFGEEKPERLAELAAELVRLKVDLIVIAGTPSASAAKKATTTTPS